MKKTARIAGIIFLILSLIDVIPMAFGFSAIHHWVKPFLIPSLATAALCTLLPEFGGSKTVLLSIGMTLHTVGDVMLIFDDRSFIFFALGLAAFLLGHFIYLYLMLSGMGALKGWKEILLCVLPIPITLVCTGFLGAEGPIRYAVLIYAYTLLAELATGALWMLRKRRMGIRILLGALSFIGSDTLLALNTFTGMDFPLRHALVMATYLTAEWLLVSGMVRERSGV